MNGSLGKLRKKYIITASVIVFAVIMLMILVLNLLMRITYRSEENMIESVIGQAAVTHINQPNKETFELCEAEQTDNGDYIIPRSVRDISSITVNGSIKCADSKAIWYSAGGGLLFEADLGSGREMVYKDYSFSRDTTNVSIGFDNFNNVKCGYEPMSIDESQIVSDYFLVSVIWWRNSSSVPEGNDENVTLEISSIEVHYKEQHTISAASNKLVSHISFSDIFEDNIPEILNNTGAFYLIADKEGQLLSVNDGNLANTVENEEARGYISEILENGWEKGKIEKDESVYSYSLRSTDDVTLIIFVNDSFISRSSSNLMRVSLFVGGLIWSILFVLIVIVSGYVIKPVAENMELQKQFISNASHELKTPITVISTTIDIIGTKKGSDCWTECIKEQAKKMQRLVSELLDLSRLLEVHNAKRNFRVSDISGTVSNSLLYFESLFFESEKTLTQNIEEGISMFCDETKISQLVGIFVDNALKYSDEKSEISFSLVREKDNAVIKCTNPCADFGIKDTSRLFERFYRSDNDRIHEQEGFGLGLSIAQAITELHGGKISAEYTGGMITFKAVLPVRSS